MFIISEFSLLSDYVNVYKLVNLSGDIITRITFSDKYKLPDDGVYSINSYGPIYAKIRKKLKTVKYVNSDIGFNYRFMNDEIYITKIDLKQIFGIKNLANQETITIGMYDRDPIKLTSEIIYLPNLKKLEISQEVNIPYEIFNLVGLESLEINFNDFKITSDIRNLVNLKYINITYYIRQISINHTYFPNLRTLCIFNGKMTTLCPEIGLLQQLKKLDIFESNIRHLPISIGNLTNLETLSIKSISIRTIPTELGYLTNLKNLRISTCPKLESIPSEIGNLTNLINLSISNVTIPPEIRNLVNLKYSEIWSCSIPPEILNLSNLNTLVISSTDTIPPEIRHLVNLEILVIMYSRELKSIPSEIGNLTNLRILKLEETGITKLPTEFYNISTLQQLITDKSITNIPDSLLSIVTSVMDFDDFRIIWSNL